MKNYFVFIGIAIMLCVIGCSSDEVLENPTDLDAPVGLSAAPLGDVVFENMYAAEAATLADKTPIQIVTVIEGTGRVTLNARFRGVLDLGFGFPLYECELTDADAHAMGGIAKGMSGSPVGPPGRIMGALAYGDNFPGTPHRFLVTSIGAMDAAITHQTFGDLLDARHVPAAPSGKINSVWTPVKTPMMITGIQPHRLPQIAAYLKGPRYNFIEIFSGVGGTVDAPVHNTTGLAAGDMIGVAVTRGDVVNSIGFGTVTQVYDDKFAAFGHPMDGEGQAALPVYRAVVRGIVPNLEASYKSSAIYGNPIGMITKDLTPGIVGQLGVLPKMIPVKVTYQIDEGAVIEKHHEVAYGQEAFIAIIAATTADTIRQEKSPGTVNGTITIRFKETEKTYTETYRITSPGLFQDTLLNVAFAIETFTDMFVNNAGKATLAEVSIAITETPIIKRAAVHDVIVPEAIVPGESATFKVVLLPHWSAAPRGERMIQREVTLDIPQNFPIGNAQLSVVAEAGDGDFVFTPFDDVPEEPPPAENLEDFIKQMENNQIEQGLITITLLPIPADAVDDFLFDDQGPGDGDIDLPPPPEDFVLEEDDIPTPEDIVLPEPIEKAIIVEGFIITGSKEIAVDIAEPGPTYTNSNK